MRVFHEFPRNFPTRHSAVFSIGFAPLQCHRPEPTDPPLPDEPDPLPDPTREPPEPAAPPIGDPPPQPREIPRILNGWH